MKWTFNKVMIIIYGVTVIVSLLLFVRSPTVELGFLTTWLLIILLNIDIEDEK